MKRPDLEVLFAAVPLTPADLAEAWLSFMIHEREGTLSSYYTRVELDPLTGDRDRVDESLDVQNSADLLRRVYRDEESGFKVRLPFQFANGDVVTLLLPDGARGTASHLIVEPSITRFVEDEETTRPLLLSLLVAAANHIGSRTFLAGLHMPWVPLTDELLARGGGPDSRAYAAGWRSADLIPVADPVRDWQPPAPSVVATATGYAVATRF